MSIKPDLMDSEKVLDGDVPAYLPKPDLDYGETFEEAQSKTSFATRLGITPQSFKRRTLADAHNQLNQTLKSRHLHMIAIGGSIGAGLFVGSGAALSHGGPASLLIDFIIIGVMMLNVVYALGELAYMFPISGGFYTYSARFIDPSWGFAMGWNYVLQWVIVIPLELTVAGLTVGYWDPDGRINIAVWISVFLVAIIILNIFGVLGYGEEEFWASALKLSAIIIFFVIALVLIAGGGPAGGEYDQYWGARTWYADSGAFKNGFKGFCSVFVTAAFAFSGTELVGLAAAESKDPQRSLPGAIKQVFWRITLFYVLSLLFVGLLVYADDPRLLGSGLSDSSTSPFVIAAANAGLTGYDSFLNVVILVSVMSIGNAGVYGGSRTLTALAEFGFAPSIFKYIDRAGRPLPSTVFCILFGGLGYIVLASDGNTVFTWLQAISALAALFTWGSICIAHIRFRAAWARDGHTLDELPFRALFGVWGSWLGFILIVLVLIAQFYVALYPIGSDTPSAEDFFESYLAAPVVILFYIGCYIYTRKSWIPLSKIDIDSGRREIDWEQVERSRQERRTGNLAKRIYHIMC